VKAAYAGLALLLLAAAAQAHEDALKVSGYAKGLLIDSRTVVGPDEHYTLNLNRLRLELKGPITQWLSVDLQVDNELLLGDYLHTQQFRLQKDLPPPTWWNARTAWLDERRAYGEARLYRGSLSASFGDTDLRLGRQRIAWGTGRFWSPLDILNPFSPTALERAERIGVDALLVEHKLDALSRVAFAYAPQHDAREASAAAMWHANRSGVDYSLVAGRCGRSKVLGADLAGQIGQAGIRAELTRTVRENAPGYVRALVGADYVFANTLSLSGELFYDGSGILGRHYLGVSGSYDITPLLKTRHDVVLNLDDGSRYYSPTLSYSIRTNLDAMLGAQLFGGAKGTEFGAFKRVLYLQLQWFF
jgi:hypothetical protein